VTNIAEMSGLSARAYQSSGCCYIPVPAPKLRTRWAKDNRRMSLRIVAGTYLGILRYKLQVKLTIEQEEAYVVARQSLYNSRNKMTYDIHDIKLIC
jgi:hypothetical protein